MMRRPLDRRAPKGRSRGNLLIYPLRMSYAPFVSSSGTCARPEVFGIAAEIASVIGTQRAPFVLAGKSAGKKQKYARLHAQVDSVVAFQESDTPSQGAGAVPTGSEHCTSGASLVPNVSRQGIASPFPVAPFSVPSFRLKPTTHPEQTIRQGLPITDRLQCQSAR